jgi:RimJ/RimL family protein N-acetyltransferase
MEHMRMRPIEPADRDALAAAFTRLSPESRMRRFHASKPKLSERELTYLTQVDHVTHEALAAFDAQGQIVGVARYAASPSEGHEAAEVAVAVIDPFQHRGIGSALAARVVERARANGFARLSASTFLDNGPARALVARLGFRRVGVEYGVGSYELELVASDDETTSGGW